MLKSKGSDLYQKSVGLFQKIIKDLDNALDLHAAESEELQDRLGVLTQEANHMTKLKQSLTGLIGQ